jgi:hypothetical protein
MGGTNRRCGGVKTVTAFPRMGWFPGETEFRRPHSGKVFPQAVWGAAAKAFAAVTSAAGVLRLWRRVCAEKHGFGDDQVAARARRDRVAASGWESQWR